MGAYNRLMVPRLEPCPGCRDEGNVTLQFKWGLCALDDYRLGETVRWSEGTPDHPKKGPLDKGDPVVAQVTLPAVAEPCSQCGIESDEEYEVTIITNRIAEYRFVGWG